MQCSGATCTAIFTGANSFSDILSPAQAAQCTVAKAWGSPNVGIGGFYDPYDCLSISQNGYQWPAYGTGNAPPLAPNAFPSFCCFVRELYVSANLPFSNLFTNSAVLYQNSSFSNEACSLLTDARRNVDFPAYQHQLIACPNAGILDALESFVPQNHTNTCTWGLSLSASAAFQVVGPIVYDPTPQQSANLFSLTHAFCPALSPGISYTSNLATAMNPSNWFDLSLTVQCCARTSQTSLTGDFGETCNASACWTSPQCMQLLGNFCTNPNNQRSDICFRWKSVTTGNLQNVADFVVPNSWQFAKAGSYPSSFDEAMFSLLGYCTNVAGSLQDPELCAAMQPQGLLFPRIRTLQLSNVYQQFNTSLTVKTLSFSITNMSSLFLQSLSALKDDPQNNFTVTFGTQSLPAGSSTDVTVTTTLSTFSTLAAALPSLYLTSASANLVLENFNFDAACGTTTMLQMPVPSSCAVGDTEIDLQVLQNTSETIELAPAFPSGLCSELWALHSESGGMSAFPGCSCTSALGCAGGFEANCAPSRLVTQNVTSMRVCASTPLQMLPVFFVDSVTWNANVNDTLSQEFPLFGGFVTGVVANPMNFFLTPSLVVFPLTSNALLN